MNEDRIDDAVAAAAFRRLLAHLRHREDAQNVDLMGLAGFCRNCLEKARDMPREPIEFHQSPDA